MHLGDNTLGEIMITKHFWQLGTGMGNIFFPLLGFMLLQFTQAHATKEHRTLTGNDPSDIIFKKSMDYLNTLQVEDQSVMRSSIKITHPNNTTVWAIANPVEIAWTTENIPKDKTIRFYLSQDDMVVQELGTFKNNNFISGIKLNRTLQAGNNYRVIGLELFPTDKYSIAKFATPFFTIHKTPGKKEVEVKVVEEKAPIRNTFRGRNISYVKELVVDSEEIRISLWDHGRKDGDIVSIYLNGEAIVSEYFLTYRKKHFDIKLDATKPNDLFLYAHNLGKFPPNTVSIEITDGKVPENIILNSDLKSCEAVLIKVKE